MATKLQYAVQRFSQHYSTVYEAIRPAIEQRISEFRHHSIEQCFYELCFCLCTPQSKAEHAWQVQRELERRDFYRRSFDPRPLLRSRTHYIRFHNQKAERLLQLKAQWPEIQAIVSADVVPSVKRQWLVATVKGLGWKEASHYLRNTGTMTVAILDRHILRLLHQEFHLVDTERPPTTRRRYEMLEQQFCALAEALNQTPAHLDLFLWYLQTGKVLK